MAQPSSDVESMLHKLFAVSDEEEANSADAGVVEEPEHLSGFETPYRFKCTRCGYRGRTRTDAERHIKRHTGEKPFWCVECDAKFAKMDQIKEHKRRNPRGECRLKSPNQLGGTQVPGASNEGANEVFVFEPGKCKWYPSGKKYKCRRCEYRSNLRKNVVRHAQCHSTAKPFACVPCKKDFARRDKLKEHRDKYHSGRGPIKCNRCDFAAMRGATWRNHQMTAHSIPFEKIMMECLSETTGEHLNGECGVDSIASDTLDPAEAQGWLSETPSTSDPSTPAAFAIDEAEGWFEMETIEIEECTGPGEVHSCDTTAEEDDVVDAEPNSKHTDTRRKCAAVDDGHHQVISREVFEPFGCSRCTATYRYQYHLDAHMRTCNPSSNARRHAKKRSYTCNQCGAVFLRKLHLASHMVVHSDTRPFACSECDFTTKRKSELTVHQREHTGERFKCPHCAYVHTKKSRIRMHGRRVHSQDVEPLVTSTNAA